MIGQGAEIVIVTPVFEDGDSARILFKRLAAACTHPLHIVVIDDGSVRSPPQIEDLTAAGVSGEILRLRRNMGHQRAIATGICHIAETRRPAAVICMDSDGEDVPEVIPELLERLAKGDVDIVVAERRKRSEGLVFRVFYQLYRGLFETLTGRAIRFGNFSALSGRAVRRLSSMQEIWVHLAASLMTSRLPVASVLTDRGTRYSGKSKMSFVSLALHGMRSVMVFADEVLVRVGTFSIILAGSSIGLIVLATLLKFIGFSTPGWFSTALGILLIIVLQAAMLMFVTLMVAGIFRSAPPIVSVDLKRLIDEIDTTPGALVGEPAARIRAAT
jgi:polyisoprenyl-phosphate glycosyltransferase